MTEIDIVQLLNKSSRPLLHLGNGARGADWDLGIPIVTARNANDLIPSDHPLFVGRPGTFGQRGANFAVQTCDLYIAVGTSLSLTQTGYNSKDYARNAQIVHVDIDQAVLDKGTLRDPIKIRMDAKEFLSTIGRVHRSPWLAQCQAWKRMYPPVTQEQREQKEYVNSFHFIDVLSDLAAPTDTIVTDMGFAFQNTHQAWKTKRGQRLLSNCGLAPMGWGLPAAVGAAFATGKRVIAIVGDGGLMMNIQELATLMHHKLNIKIFILNNGGYLTIKQTQQLGFEGRLMGVNEESGLSFPDFHHLGQAFNMWLDSPNAFNPLKPQLEEIMSAETPTLCEIMMDPDQAQIPRSLNRRNADGTMTPTKLEDSYPFLPAEEVAEQMRYGR